MDKDKVFNVKEAIRAQKAYCEREQLPQFAPEDGYCWSCHEQIYRGPHGIDVAQAGGRLITGCPLCRVSFLD